MCWIRQQTTNEGESCIIKIQPVTYPVTGKTFRCFLNAYQRAQVIAQKHTHTSLALSSFTSMKVKRYPIRTPLLYALRIGHWTIGESFLGQHLLSHFSVNHKPLTSFQRHLLNKHARGLEDAKPSLRKLALQRSWWSTQWKACFTWNGNNIHDSRGKRNKMAKTMKFLPCINIWNEFFLNGIFRGKYQDVRILPPLVNVQIWSQGHICLWMQLTLHTNKGVHLTGEHFWRSQNLF